MRQLSAAGHSVYLDAGHARWKSTGETAERLLAAGIADAEGFAVNVSNRQTTAASIAWGRELSDLVGNGPSWSTCPATGSARRRTARAAPPSGATRRTRPSASHRPRSTGAPGVDALLWIKRPGESDGKCGGEVSYFFSPRQARELIVNSPDVPPDARHSAQLASAPPATRSPMG